MEYPPSHVWEYPKYIRNIQNFRFTWNIGYYPIFRVACYQMIFKTKWGGVRYRQKYRVAGRVPVGHWLHWGAVPGFTQIRICFLALQLGLSFKKKRCGCVNHWSVGVGIRAPVRLRISDFTHRIAIASLISTKDKSQGTTASNKPVYTFEESQSCEVYCAKGSIKTPLDTLW